MKPFHALFPISTTQTLDKRHADAFTYLNARQAMVHLLVHHESTEVNPEGSASLHTFQRQQDRMRQYLKYEVMDQFAMQIQRDYPQLSFSYHVVSEPLSRFVMHLQAENELDMVLIDDLAIGRFLHEQPDLPLAFLNDLQDIPVRRFSSNENLKLMLPNPDHGTLNKALHNPFVS